MDASNGYERIATELITARSAIGGAEVFRWAQQLPSHSAVLDLGCGAGIPITQSLLDAGLDVYGIDASPSLLNELKRRFPAVSVACENAVQSNYFSRRFHGVVAWGLLFLLTAEEQKALIKNVAGALEAGGRFLFTAPASAATWRDMLTSMESRSLGALVYRQLLKDVDLQVIKEYEDEGQNHYFDTVKAVKVNSEQ